MKRVEPVSRVDFVKKIMHTGLTYVQASRAYDAFITTVEDAVVSGGRVNFGRLGALKPVPVKSRAVHMGFSRGKKGVVTKSSRTFFIGRRIKYKFELYKAFARSHDMKWFDLS